MPDFWIFILVPLLVKHWYIDFVNQSSEEIATKGTLGAVPGIYHSLKHGIGTFICIAIVTGPIFIFGALAIGFADALLHYFIDWIKANYGNRDINNPKFWNHLGLDQLAHQLCYISYAVYTELCLLN